MCVLQGGLVPSVSHVVSSSSDGGGSVPSPLRLAPVVAVAAVSVGVVEAVAAGGGLQGL